MNSYERGDLVDRVAARGHSYDAADEMVSDVLDGMGEAINDDVGASIETPQEVVRGESMRLRSLLQPALERFEASTGLRVRSIVPLRHEIGEEVEIVGLEISIEGRALGEVAEEVSP